MALTCSFRWQNSDSTSDLNNRLRVLVKKGIYWGGTVTPGIGLRVSVSEFIGVSFDGMTIGDTATTVLNVLANTTQYVVVRAKYNALGSPVTPTLAWQVLTQAQYNAEPDKDSLTIFAKVTLGPVAVVLNSDIDLSVRDEVTQVGRAWFRGVAANIGALPAPPPAQNLIGDHYYVIAANTFYFWTGLIWSPMTTSGYNSETIHHNRDLVGDEIQRLTNGSGVIGGTRYGTPGFQGSKLDIDITGTPLVNDSVDIDTFAATIYGHDVITKATTLALAAKPAGLPNRYDLIFLEIWRETLAVPETHGYERNPTGAGTYTIDQATLRTESMSYTSGIGGDNFDFNTVGTSGHAGYVIKWRFGTVQDVSSVALYDPYSGLAGWAVPNIDGNNFVVPGGGTRVWYAPAAVSSIDGASYAIPLFVLRRRHTEAFGVDPIAVYVRGSRHIFPVYPVADISKLARDTAETAAMSGPLSVALKDAMTPTLQPNEKPSGFLSSMDYEVGPGIAVHTLKFYQEAAKIRIRGFEDWVGFNVNEFYLGNHAVGANAWKRVLIYIKMSITLFQHDDTDTANNPGMLVSRQHRPLIPAHLIAGVVNDIGQGWRRGFVTYQVMVRDFGNIDYRDADDSMTAAGWTKGDVFLAGSTLSGLDGGLWSKAVTIDQDDRIHPFLTEWAIPVALVHRRNGNAWDAAGNPNGSTATRPDTRTNADIIHPDDLVDLRSEVDVDPATLAQRLTADFDRNMKGQLRTRMANKWAGAGLLGEVAGTRILQSDCIGGVAVPGTFALVAGDGYRTIWSDAKEFMPVCASFALNATTSNTLYSFNHLTGNLDISAPLGAHIVRWLPSAFVAGGYGTTDYLQFNGPPLWSTRETLDRSLYPFPTAAEAKVLNSAGTYDTESNLALHAAFVADSYLRFDATGATKDTYGRITSMSYTTPTIAALNADVASLSWWVHYDRILADGDYADNYGLAEIPDEVHSIVKDYGGTNITLNNGTLYTVVRVSVLAADTDFTITEAMVRTASGTPGVSAVLVGIASENMKYSGVPINILNNVSMPIAQDQITVDYTGNFGSDLDIDVIVFYYTTGATAVTEWLDIGRGGKSVMGPFHWEEQALDTTSAGGAATLAACTLGNSWWRHADVAGMSVEMPIVWYKVGVIWYQARLHRANEWGIPGALPLSAGYPFSNTISLSTIPAGAPVEIKIVVPATTPVTSNILINYTYTPYQGLSNSGGAITNPLPAADLARIKALGHGTVLCNTDWVITQSGACSKFGGVDSWTGWPVREPDRYLNYQYSAFADFNSPRLVRTRQQGLQDTFGRNSTNTNAAAALRLPSPDCTNSAANRPLPQVHDLDPGREGASCGWFSYAPAYYNMLTVDTGTPGTVVSFLHKDQFVNGITPLNSYALQYQEELSEFIPACSFKATPINAAVYASTAGANNFFTWDFDGGVGNLSVDCSMHLRRQNILCSTFSYLENWGVPNSNNSLRDDLADSMLVFNTMRVNYGITAAHALAYNYLHGFQTLSWTGAWSAFGGAIKQDKVILCHGCGTIHLYYQSMLLDTQPTLRIHDTPDGASVSTERFFGTNAIVENFRTMVYGQNVVSTSTPGLRIAKPVDTVVLPWTGSGSRAAEYNALSSDTSHVPNYYNDSSSAALIGTEIKYPDSWDPGTITAAEALLRASEVWTNVYGRGVCLTDFNGVYRFNMPILVPGSGTPMNDVFAYTTLPVETAESPASIPSAPYTSPFARSHRCYDSADHGGAIAYCGFGLHINPSAATYHGRCVMQITGGILGQIKAARNYEYAETIPTPDETNASGTALDFFWPTGRPILQQK